MLTDYLFVYGTLRPAVDGTPHPLLAEGAELLGGASVSGILFRVGEYPGVVPADTNEQRVIGEVYRLNDPDFLRRLDEYEGFDSGDPASSLFRREETEAVLESGRTLRSWIYLYNRPTDALEIIPSGDSGRGSP